LQGELWAVWGPDSPHVTQQYVAYIPFNIIILSYKPCIRSGTFVYGLPAESAPYRRDMCASPNPQSETVAKNS